MEEMKAFKYLGAVLCKHGGMERKITQRAVKGRDVIGSLARLVRGRNISMEVKRGI